MLLPPHLFCIFRYIRPRAAYAVCEEAGKTARVLVFTRTRPFAPQVVLSSSLARLRFSSHPPVCAVRLFRQPARVLVFPRVASNEPYARNKGESRARRLSVHASFTSAPARLRRLFIRAYVARIRLTCAVVRGSKGGGRTKEAFIKRRVFCRAKRRVIG